MLLPAFDRHVRGLIDRPARPDAGEIGMFLMDT